MAERRRPMQAQDKLAFLLALVPYLMDRDRVSVAEAAEHFGVEKSQLREAVQQSGADRAVPVPPLCALPGWAVDRAGLDPGRGRLQLEISRFL